MHSLVLYAWCGSMYVHVTPHSLSILPAEGQGMTQPATVLQMGLTSLTWRWPGSWAAQCFLQTWRCCRSNRCGPLRLARSAPSRKRSHLRRLRQLLHTAALALPRVSPDQQRQPILVHMQGFLTVLLYVWL